MTRSLLLNSQLYVDVYCFLYKYLVDNFESIRVLKERHLKETKINCTMKPSPFWLRAENEHVYILTDEDFPKPGSARFIEFVKERKLFKLENDQLKPINKDLLFETLLKKKPTKVEIPLTEVKEQKETEENRFTSSRKKEHKMFFEDYAAFENEEKGKEAGKFESPEKKENIDYAEIISSAKPKRKLFGPTTSNDSLIKADSMNIFKYD